MTPLLALLACLPPAEPPATPTDTPPPGETDDTAAATADLEQSGPIPCGRPEDRDALGAMYLADLGSTWATQRAPGLEPDEEMGYAAGLAVADFDDDGHLDVFAPTDRACMLFIGYAGGTLRDESDARLPVGGGDCRGWGASAADYDGDGDLDLYLTREDARDWLWQNDGAGRFTDVTDAAGLVTFGCASRSASWGDMDGDGDLDLFVARHRLYGGNASAPCPPSTQPTEWSMNAGDPNTLYENRGDGTFADVSERLDTDAIFGHTFLGGWHDADLDGDLDLYVVNDFGGQAAPTNLYRNDGSGQLEPFASELGASLRGTLMGLAVGDLNGDGRPDFGLTEIMRLHLLYSQGALWVDSADAAGLVPDVPLPQLAAWGTALADLDNDTLLDFVATFGPTEPGMTDPRRPQEQPDAVFLQGPDGTFADRAAELGVAQTSVGRGLVVTDFDGNGWLDLLRTDFRRGPATVYLARCGAAAWLQVDLDGPNHGYHATVEVEVGGRVLTRWSTPSSTSLASSGPPGVHFGLGDAERVQRLTVRWQDGSEQSFEDIEARQRVRVHAP